MLIGKVILNKQECEGICRFTGIAQYMTKGFKETFGIEVEAIAFTAIALIMETYPENADYFQTLKYVYPDDREVKFWCINDEDHLTMLLPSEY